MLSDRTTTTGLLGFAVAAGPILDQLAAVGDQVANSDGGRAGRAGIARRHLATRPFPGSPVWAAMDARKRAEWWASQISTVLCGPAAAPQLLGPASDRFPIGAAVEAAARGLVVCATAREHGVTSPSEHVSLLARVLLERDIESRDSDAGTWSLPRRPHGVTEVIAESVRVGRSLRTLFEDVTTQLHDVAPPAVKKGWRRVPGIGFVLTAKEMRAKLHADAQNTAELLEGISTSWGSARAEAGESSQVIAPQHEGMN